MAAMTDDLKQATSASLKALFSNGTVETPIDTFELLTKLISHGATRPAASRFRLTDLKMLEAILEEFADQWDAGVLELLRDDTGMSVIQVQLNTPGEAPRSRKRKRQVDEDADSAEEDNTTEPATEKESLIRTKTLSGLTKNMHEVYALLQKGTARGRLMAEQFRSEGPFEPICPQITKDECAKLRRSAGTSSSNSQPICDRVHFRPLIRPHTDPSLGHCSYLNTCYSEPTYAQSPSIPPFPSANLTRPPGSVPLPNGLGAGGRGKEKAPCRYLHFEVDWDGGDGDASAKNQLTQRKSTPHKLAIGLGPTGKQTPLLPPQWINCDLRRFDYTVLGKFHVIMADPPWDIHMSLPYGTMTDDEMKAMPIPMLQDEGLLFLWVTGRAMEIGRECMRVWGYTRVDEVVWVKTNQLQRVIRTGRTGHWLNHTKEHMLVGVKTHWDSEGNLAFPSWCNRGLDTDVVVAEVRETSRKPDEVYGMIERMCPGGRKVEIFGRKHNARAGWLTLGNQLGHDQIYEEDLKARIKAKYPERSILPAPVVASSANDVRQ
ncbi:MT-A70-domain-containing protein [Rickenella mellea]|uniref:mRNA m(6)A methyltransferase n=1 Tax=Rickenella mellea TaxID=50990 RepID=A0A4R5XE42_9AGAM|nr:MT-A70-domain-containing protein [Rickenella mellea]